MRTTQQLLANGEFLLHTLSSLIKKPMWIQLAVLTGRNSHAPSKANQIYHQFRSIRIDFDSRYDTILIVTTAFRMPGSKNSVAEPTL